MGFSTAVSTEEMQKMSQDMLDDIRIKNPGPPE